MQKKLTLNIDEEFEEYLLQLKKQENKEKVHLRLENLYGIFENEPIPDKKELRNRL